ncbi:YhcB family protein [Halomonas sp. MA07-2]|uniref:YhcB family protein n=1 Tax=unclassified Halomonas TaxID=2609666 RepID=UPI003EEECAFE
MDASKINWMLAIACLLAGIGLGALGYHLLNASAASLQKLRQRLAERDRELTALREGMDDHLGDVSRLVATLQRDSEALASRLSQDAQRLRAQGTPPAALAVIESEAPAEGNGDELAMPRDYADGTGGTLSEDFGLKDDEDAKAPQPPRY